MRPVFLQVDATKENTIIQQMMSKDDSRTERIMVVDP